MSTRTEKFHKKSVDPKDTNKENEKELEEVVKFSPEIEAVRDPHIPVWDHS